MSSGLGRAFALFTGASAIGSITQVIKGKFTALALGADGVGILTLLTNLWSLFSVLATLGFYNGLLRHLAPAWEAEERTQFRRHMSSNALVMMTSACVLAFLGCLASPWLSDFLFPAGTDYSNLICLILLSIPVFVAGQIYRAMLNSVRATSAVVRVRIGADVLSVIALIGLLYLLDLKGAVLGYIALHVLYLLFAIYFVRKELGPDMLVPDPGLFTKEEVRRNLGFGLNGLVAVTIGIVTSLLISRWIIAMEGPEGNGLYMMAVKVATVYLGGLSAAAGGYYFPTLSAAKDDTEMFGIMNQTWAMYMQVLPPIICVLMLSGEWLMLLLFTSEFIPAAVFLLLLLPGDLFRVSAETLGIGLLVKKKLVVSTSAYFIWAMLYLGLSAVLLPAYGLLGVAIAYLVSQAYSALQQVVIARLLLGYWPNRVALLSLLRGVLLVAITAGLIKTGWPFAVTLAAAGVALGAWGLMSWSDPAFRSGVKKLARRVGLNRFI